MPTMWCLAWIIPRPTIFSHPVHMVNLVYCPDGAVQKLAYRSDIIVHLSRRSRWYVSKFGHDAPYKHRSPLPPSHIQNLSPLFPRELSFWSLILLLSAAMTVTSVSYDIPHCHIAVASSSLLSVSFNPSSCHVFSHRSDIQITLYMARQINLQHMQYACDTHTHSDP